MKAIFGCLLAILTLMACNNQVQPDETEKTASNRSSIDGAKAKLEQLKETVAAGRKDHKYKQKLREEVGLKRFNDSEIEISQAEFFYDSTFNIHSEVIFFKIIPVGMKRWYFIDDDNAHIEVFDYEKGADDMMEEKLLYRVQLAPSLVLFYDATEDLSMEKQAELSLEFTKEHERLKELAEKYRPK